MKKFFNNKNIDFKNPIHIIIVLAIIFFGYSFYNPALRFVPVDYDDLVLLSVAKNVHNPLSFFYNDWGLGNNAYRPLHSISIWLTSRVFGVSSGPNQLVNIILHIAVMVLLYLFISRLTRNVWIAFLATCLGLVSLYTFSPPTWVSDRPTLFVALFLLISLNYLESRDKDKKPGIGLLLAFSALGLMSKESGLIIPAIIILYLLLFFQPDKPRRNQILALVLLLGLYLVFRILVFGREATSYAESGYLFGFEYYATSADLPPFQRIIAMADNVLKNILAVFLPIFDGQGKLSLIGTTGKSVIILMCTAVLAAASLNKKLEKHQIIGFAILLINALIHFQVFRYRTLYLGQIGFMIFMAGSRSFMSENRIRSILAALAALVLILVNIGIMGENLTYLYLSRLDILKSENFRSDILSSSRLINREVIDLIIQKYLH